eukprot:726216-Rhodomonas_salina.1
MPTTSFTHCERRTLIIFIPSSLRIQLSVHSNRRFCGPLLWSPKDLLEQRSFFTYFFILIDFNSTITSSPWFKVDGTFLVILAMSGLQWKNTPIKRLHGRTEYDEPTLADYVEWVDATLRAVEAVGAEWIKTAIEEYEKMD